MTNKELLKSLKKKLFALVLVCIVFGFSTTAFSAVNVALTSTVSADVEQSGNYATNANDGNAKTRWCATDNGTSHWLKLDLGAAFKLGGCQIVWEFDGDINQYLIEGSNDDNTYSTILDKTSNIKTSQIQTEGFAGTVQCRYVRIKITGLSNNHWASMYEFSVFGVPATSASPAPVINDLAVTGTASADVEESGNYALNAIDGSDSTRWCASDANTGHWWKVDLGTIYSLGGCQIIWEKNGNPYQYLVEVSNDDINYTTALDNTSNYSTNTQIQYSDFPDATKGRYVRITVTGGLETNTLWASFYNFAVLGRALPVAIHRNNPKNDMATALTVTNNVSATTINYSVVSAGSAHIDLRIYDARGSVVKTLVNGLAEPGTYSVIFDGRNNDGKRLTAGQYICCFRSISENGTVVEKTTVVPMVR